MAEPEGCSLVPESETIGAVVERHLGDASRRDRPRGAVIATREIKSTGVDFP